VTRNPHKIFPDGTVQIKLRVGSLRKLIAMSDETDAGKHWDD
jgi:hypothetical protein